MERPTTSYQEVWISWHTYNKAEHLFQQAYDL